MYKCAYKWFVHICNYVWAKCTLCIHVHVQVHASVSLTTCLLACFPLSHNNNHLPSGDNHYQYLIYNQSVSPKHRQCMVPYYTCLPCFLLATSTWKRIEKTKANWAAKVSGFCSDLNGTWTNSSLCWLTNMADSYITFAGLVNTHTCLQSVRVSEFAA